MLSAGVLRSWSRSSSGAIKRRCRISRSWNMQRRLLSISSNWGGKTRYFIYLHWLHTQKVFIVNAAPEYLDGCSWCSAVAPHAWSLSPKPYGNRNFSQELKHEIKFRSCHFLLFTSLMLSRLLKSRQSWTFHRRFTQMRPRGPSLRGYGPLNKKSKLVIIVISLIHKVWRW